ncbi:AMP-binding protein [Williamsia sp. CHRR-6]|uniref:AMP-binding protein n=1 Tax=Williamsia sp. CHRR-6 TaxID=2835871 RepID=UPI001BD9AD9D|nr:AMP-binding protein [Williamsia sp. CHRR-6]MBT0568082.1 AMP-binding protein [Williamsia sp. CHRR-6]
MEQSISRLISRRALTDPDAVMVACLGPAGESTATMTAAQLDRHSNRLTRVLIERGVRPDDLVTLAADTTIEFVSWCVAIWKAGATPQPIAPDLDPAQRGALEAVVRPALAIGSPPVDPEVPWIALDHPAHGFSDDELPDLASRSWKAPTSSGSTGTPKVVVATAAARFDPDRAIAPFIPRAVTQLVCGPLWHSATFTYAMRGLMTDHHLVLLPRPDPHAVLTALRSWRIGWTVWSPTLIHEIVGLGCELDRFDCPALHSVLHIGAPCPAQDKRALIAWLGPHRVVEVYAGSESNGRTMIDGRDWLAHPGSVGRGLDDTEIEIRGVHGTPLAPGHHGTIWMRRRGPTRYHYLGGRSQRTVDGWDTLGDIGFCDKDGWLTVIDRAADRISCAGAVVYPAVIEHQILEHPAVRDAVVYAVPDRHGTTRMCAVIDIGDHDVDLAQVRAHARSRLGDGCSPGSVTVQRSRIRNAAGKVRRAAMARAEPRDEGRSA